MAQVAQLELLRAIALAPRSLRCVPHGLAQLEALRNCAASYLHSLRPHVEALRRDAADEPAHTPAARPAAAKTPTKRLPSSAHALALAD